MHSIVLALISGMLSLILVSSFVLCLLAIRSGAGWQMALTAWTPIATIWISAKWMQALADAAV